MGCSVCGYGIDWRWYSDWFCMQPLHPIISFNIGWMRSDYLCVRCVDWARAAGAESTYDRTLLTWQWTSQGSTSRMIDVSSS